MASISQDPPATTGKRKRTVVSYAQNDDLHGIDDPSSEAEAVSEDESDDEYGNLNTTKKKADKKSKNTNLKVQTVSFTTLSAELRNKIYELALVDNEEGVRLFVLDDELLRTDHRRSRKPGPPGYGVSRPEPYKRGPNYKAAKFPSRIATNLLLANKQVYSEGINVLYGQPLRFHDPAAVCYFLTAIGLRNRIRVRNVCVGCGNYRGRFAGAARDIALTLLGESTNLQALHINAVSCWESPEDQAGHVYSRLQILLRAFGAARGDSCAGVGVLKFEVLAERQWNQYQYKKKKASETSEETEPDEASIKAQQLAWRPAFDLALREMLGG